MRLDRIERNAVGNGPAGAGRARSEARKAEVTRSNRVGCARKAYAESAGIVAAQIAAPQRFSRPANKTQHFEI